MKKIIALLLSVITITTVLSSCSPKNNKVYHEDDSEWEYKATEEAAIPYSNWGFQNADGVTKGLAKIEYISDGNYVSSDEKGNYVIIQKDNDIHWQFFSQQGQWIRSKINNNFSFGSSEVTKITVLNNDMATVTEAFESYTLSVVKRFTSKDYPVFEISDSYKSMFFIPFDLIDTDKEIEFHSEGNYHYDYYKFYLK